MSLSWLPTIDKTSSVMTSWSLFVPVVMLAVISGETIACGGSTSTPDAGLTKDAAPMSDVALVNDAAPTDAGATDATGCIPCVLGKKSQIGTCCIQ